MPHRAVPNVKMSRLTVLVLILAAAAAALGAIALRRPAQQSRTVAVRHEIVAAPASSPTATPTSVPTREPKVTAAPSAGPSATAAPTSSPTPAVRRNSRPASVQTNVPVLNSPPPTSAPRVASEEPPKILSVAVSNQTVAVGDVVNGHVETTSNVASVEASIGGYVAPLRKTGVGQFALAYRVPDLPIFLRHRTYSITVIAHNVRGDTTQTSVPITIQ